ncbi:hypothetical protein B0H14DRAFT_2629506 [Mycena olivaceomarginata]|nr:hypothetical protein B0H14DRAFT_2629506 [Mycena olivaceomarginata]
MGKQEAPDPESIDELKAHLANMKKAQAERCPRGRPSKPKNKSKAPKAGTEDDTATNTPTDANAKEGDAFHETETGQGTETCQRQVTGEATRRAIRNKYQNGQKKLAKNKFGAPLLEYFVPMICTIILIFVVLIPEHSRENLEDMYS